MANIPENVASVVDLVLWDLAGRACRDERASGMDVPVELSRRIDETEWIDLLRRQAGTCPRERHSGQTGPTPERMALAIMESKL